jgi:hypothetical protein
VKYLIYLGMGILVAIVAVWTDDTLATMLGFGLGLLSTLTLDAYRLSPNEAKASP